MKKRIIPERWEQIIEMVEVQGSLSVDQIAQALGVSSATVRRDLAHIHQRGLIKRTRGGAEPSPKVKEDRTLSESRRINPSEKEIIGAAAAELVESGDTLMFDGGFTTYQTARQIRATDLTVVTNSIDVANAMIGRDDVTLVIIGGELSKDSGTTVGPTTDSQLAQIRADKAIIGANAISPEEGLSSPNPFTAQTKRTMIRGAREVIVVADYTKLGRLTTYSVAPVESISTLVTDDKADESVLDAFRAAGVEVIVASAGQDKPGI